MIAIMEILNKTHARYAFWGNSAQAWRMSLTPTQGR